MQTKLNLKQNILVGSLLFGLFFGAGNLIFPVGLGQNSGQNVGIATIGFLISGVGIPILGIVASALSESDSLYYMANPVGHKFSVFFTCLLYLSIGPFFAIPRTATVAFEVGIRAFVGDANIKIWLAIFSALFFIAVLYFSLKPGKLIDNIGKFMTPLLIILLLVLIVFSFVNPMGEFGGAIATEKYMVNPFSVGLLDGYNTMDALASLAFAIIIITNIRNFGINNSSQIATEAIKSGIVCLILMSFIYASLSFIGATSLGVFEPADNGGLVLSMVSDHYLGNAGKILLAGIFVVACLKTAIGLISACAQMFSEMFENSFSYNQYAVGFTILSFLIANLGLNAIISLSIPVLMFSYPIAIVLIVLGLLYKLIHKNKTIYKWTIGLTVIAALIDFMAALPKSISGSSVVLYIIEFAKIYLPGFSIGFGWIVPAVVGFIIGMILSKKTKVA